VKLPGATHLVICCRNKATDALVKMRNMMTKLKLTKNETKTRVCKLPEEKFDFLGYTFGRCYSPRTGRAYLGTTRPRNGCNASVGRSARRPDEAKLSRRPEQLVEQINRQIIGWANYFCLGPVSQAYRAMEAHTRRRLRQWLCAKHKRKGAGSKRYSDQFLHDTFGLIRLTHRTASFPWATP